MIASVIVTSYNKPRLLDKALISLVNQSFDDFEIIVADDNSSDPQVRNVLEHYTSYKNYKYFVSDVTDEDRPKTARYATQINTAVNKYAQGKYLFYLPDDDYFHTFKLKSQVTAMEQKNWHVSYAGQLMVKESGDPIGTRFDGVIGDDFGGCRTLSNGYNILDHSQVATTRSAFDAVGGWPDGPECWSGADAYFWERLSNAGFKFNPVPLVLSTKVYRADSLQVKVFSGQQPWV